MLRFLFKLSSYGVILFYIYLFIISLIYTVSVGKLPYAYYKISSEFPYLAVDTGIMISYSLVVSIFCFILLILYFILKEIKFKKTFKYRYTPTVLLFQLILLPITILWIWGFFYNSPSYQRHIDCQEISQPYYASNINGYLVGEGPLLRDYFKELQEKEQNIEPKNGFITIRIHQMPDGTFCDMETFQIDENYERTKFNNGTLVKKVKRIVSKLKYWQRDKAVKTFHLIRLKIQDGQITEVF
ncbi:hypothetical protein [Aureivirga sp. CE67]|uniref:hypothetical protein n=1 Tax=Aureivirga sp. CE67 TaxID=1788983 RepID=UPI0018C9D83D|nr:hypothetical protein [Aureivirga sp. CE67]